MDLPAKPDGIIREFVIDFEGDFYLMF